MGASAWRARTLLVLVLGLFPGVAAAQSTISGVVTDPSGAVLPGVTVEAASPALIEKTRTVTTDVQGRYSIVDIRPGVYSVTFSLQGFSSFSREGIQVAGNITVPLNAELKVGVGGRNDHRDRCDADGGRAAGRAAAGARPRAARRPPHGEIVSLDRRGRADRQDLAA